MLKGKEDYRHGWWCSNETTLFLTNDFEFELWVLRKSCWERHQRSRVRALGMKKNYVGSVIPRISLVMCNSN